MKKIFSTFAILFMAALLWQCSGDRSGKLSGKAADYLAMMPAQKGIAYVNVEQLRESVFFEDFEDSISAEIYADHEMKEMLEATGFDLRKDVSEIYFAFSPKKQRYNDNENVLAVVVGKYQPEKIIEYAKEKDRYDEMASTEYNGFTIYASAEKKNMGFTFADDQHLIAGEESLVKNWLDAFKSGARNKSAHTDLLNGVKYKNGIWVALNAQEIADDLMDEMSGNSPLGQVPALKSLQRLIFSIEATNYLNIDASGQFSDAKNAEDFHNAIKGVVSIMKIASSSDRDVVDILNKIDISIDKNTVHVDAALSKADLEKLKGQRNGFALR